MNIKNFNIYILLSTFFKALIDIFIPIILYNAGFSILEIMYFLLVKHTIIFILNPIICILGNITHYKWLNVISIIFFYIGYSYLFKITHNISSLYLLIIFMVLYEHTYWISKHYYSIKLFAKKKMGTNVGKTVILNQVAFLFAPFLGSLLMNHLDSEIVVLLVSFLLVFSVYFMIRISFKETNKFGNYINDTTSIIKNIPKRNILYSLLDQFRFIGNFFYALYIYIYISNNIEYIGIFNIIVGVASVVFIYMFSKKIDKCKNSYLVLSSLFVMIVWFLRLNVLDSTYLLFIAILQGISEKMYEVSNGRNTYLLGKKYNTINYVMTMEGIYNFGRIIICLIGFFIIKDIKIFLYLCGTMIFVSGLIGFNIENKKM